MNISTLKQGDAIRYTSERGNTADYIVFSTVQDVRGWWEVVVMVNLNFKHKVISATDPRWSRSNVTSTACQRAAIRRENESLARFNARVAQLAAMEDDAPMLTGYDHSGTQYHYRAGV